MLTTGLNPNLLRNDLKLVWGVENDEWIKEYTDIFAEAVSTMNYERYQGLSGFPQIPVKVQGQSVTYNDILNGYYKDITNISYGMGFNVTREMMIYNQYDLISRMTKALNISVRDTVETLAANVLNNAFDSTKFTLGDGVELCGTHYLPTGATFNNESSSAADLSESSLEQALLDIAVNYVNGQGLKQAVRPRKLIVHPSDNYEAAQLLGSDKVPETNNNAINVPKSQNLIPQGYAVNHRLTDADSWFILTDQDGLVMQKVIWPAEFGQDNDFSAENMLMKTFFILAFGAYSPYCIYGCEGAA